VTKRLVYGVLVSILALSASVAADRYQSVANPSLSGVETLFQQIGRGESTTPTVSQACCKICRTGQPCGDTCISREKMCRVGAGCACSG
jgi:hypothetical protein